MLARLHGSTLCIASCHSAGQGRLNNRKIKSGRLPEFGVAVLFPFPCVTAALLLPYWSVFAGTYSGYLFETILYFRVRSTRSHARRHTPAPRLLRMSRLAARRTDSRGAAVARVFAAHPSPRARASLWRRRANTWVF